MGKSSSSSSPSSSSSGSLSVTVTDPRNDNNNGNRVSTTYAVTTKYTSVRRKYSDFQWLQQRLAVETPGAVVPIIPHKYALDKKFEPDFIEERRHHLQRFIQNVFDHPELGFSSSQRRQSNEATLRRWGTGSNNHEQDASDLLCALRVFLTIPLGDDFEKSKKLAETSTNTTTAIAQSAGTHEDRGEEAAEALAVDDTTPSAAATAKKGISSFFSKAMTLTQVTAGSVELVEVEGEEQITAITAYINQIEGHVTKLLKCTQSIVKVTSDQSKYFDELGIPIGGWRTTYQNNSITAAGENNKLGDKMMEDMSAMVQFTTDYSELLDHRYEKEQVQFYEAMEGLSLDLKAFQAALKQRYDFRVHYTAKYKKVTDKEAAITKQRGKSPESVSKALEKLQTEKEELQRKADVSRRRLEECTQRILRESERTRLYFEGSLKKCMKSYAKLQMEYNKKSNEAWMKLLPHLE